MGDEKQAKMDEDAEDDLVAQAAAEAAVRAESIHPLPKSGSLVKQSSSFRPHMHVQMQALSAHRITSSFSSRCVCVVRCCRLFCLL